MPVQNQKQDTNNSVTDLLLPLGAVAVTIFGMLFISFSVIVLTGIISGGNPRFEAKSNPNKKSGMIIISSSKSIEDEIRKSQMVTPELPLHYRSQTQLSLWKSQRAYRYFDIEKY
ncbi:hypothetical protein ACFQ2T_13905 [Methylophilus flavus]|uniref:Uncharacterized protein n=1 Tax=Methylophilus flavus TaxID=640084 RepID=A0ABW3PGW1_9PROT